MAQYERARPGQQRLPIHSGNGGGTGCLAVLFEKNSIIYSKGMNFAYFPLREFTEALGVTAKVKSGLQPFLEEVENYNMEWLFQMLMQLYTYTVVPDCELAYKFNALVALKILLDTCELPVILMVEVYFLPHVRRIATYQLQASEKHRGLDYFLAMGYPKVPEVKKLGYNYVRLASEIVTMMAVVKPYRLYRDEELAEASEFVNVLEIMRAQQWREYDMFAFYQQEETFMRDCFLRKLKVFTRCAQRYYDFFDTYLDKFIRKEYSPKVLDPRKILEAGEVFACSHVLKELKELLKEDRASIKANVLRLFTDFVRWGYIRAAYIIECEGIFEDLLRQALAVKGGKGAFRSIHGSEEQRRNLYYQVVRSLQIWAVCIPKSPMNLMEESRCSLTYKEFLKEHVEVPFSGNIKKIRDECEGNLQKNQLINLLIMKEFKKNDFDASKMRRTSSNLEELINLDKNMTSSMAALIMQAKFINDLAKPEINSSSSLSTSSPTHSHLVHLPSKATTQHLQANTEPAKENREPRSKQAFNKHKTVSLSNLLCGGTQDNVAIMDDFRCLPECDSDDENFNEECDQNFKINELRSSINGKNSFKSQGVSQKVLQDCQLETVKQVKQERKEIEQQEMVEFFQETVRSPTNSLNSSNFHLQVTKPSPCRGESNTNNSNIITPIRRCRKEKASLIYCQQRLGFPIKRNELTVAPIGQRGEGMPKNFRYSWDDILPEEAQDRSSPNPAYISIDQARFQPFLKEWPQIQGKKTLLRNKDVLLKNNKIEIGFIFESRTYQTVLLTLFITPSQNISKLKYEVACPPTVTCSERGERFNEIARHKQRKLMFYFWVKPPYALPTLALQYEMEGKTYQHTIFLPIPFNKFVKYTSRPPQSSSPILLKTHTQKLNAKDFNSTQLAALFPDFTLRKEDSSVQLTGGGQYEGKAFGLSFQLREGSHVQIRCQLPEGERGAMEGVQFLMAVLLATLRK